MKYSFFTLFKCIKVLIYYFPIGKKNGIMKQYNNRVKMLSDLVVGDNQHKVVVLASVS